MINHGTIVHEIGLGAGEGCSYSWSKHKGSLLGFTLSIQLSSLSTGRGRKRAHDGPTCRAVLPTCSCTPSLRQAEWLKTAKPGPTRHAVGTVVRLPDGVESDGPLRAGQLAVVTAEDGSSDPYRVRTADGVEQGYVFGMRALVEAEGGVVRLLCPSAAARDACEPAQIVLRWISLAASLCEARVRLLCPPMHRTHSSAKRQRSVACTQ